MENDQRAKDNDFLDYLFENTGSKMEAFHMFALCKFIAEHGDGAVRVFATKFGVEQELIEADIQKSLDHIKGYEEESGGKVIDPLA